MANIQYAPAIVASVSVRDFKAAVAWYQEKLGLTLNYAMDEMGWGELATAVGGFTIGLSSNASGAGEGANVIITLGVMDIDAARAELEANGVEFAGPTDELPGMVKLATFKDLDGNTFMLAQTLMQPE